MAKYEHYHTKFEAGQCYHIYNRSVDRKPMFKTQGNYYFFLSKFFHYLDGYIDVYAYSLLGNHFHFLIRIKDQLMPTQTKIKVRGSTDLHLMVSKQFRRFFQCYALAFNKQHNRIGTLFQTPFKRAHVHGNDALRRLVHYIHNNPQKHQLVTNFKLWKWTSYHLHLNQRPTPLKRDDVLAFFGGKKNYIMYHDFENFPEDCDLSIE